GYVLHLRRLEGFENELLRIGAPTYDVDLFVVEFADNIFDARSAHADARADRIHFLVCAPDRDFGSVTRLARDAANFHGAIGNLAHFHFEQTAHKIRMAARDDDFGTAISSCGFVTSSTTTRLASARMSPVSGSMSILRSRAAPTLFFDAERSAVETASSRISRLIPRSRSR